MKSSRSCVAIPSPSPAKLAVNGLAATGFCLLALFCLAGCTRGVTAPEDDAPRHPVSGTLTLDGEPGGRVVITFTPLTGTPGLGGYAIVDAEGKFSVIDLNHKEGLQQGEYYVTFSKRVMMDGKPIPENVPDGIDTREVLPTSMTTVDPDTHRYVIAVNDLSNSLDFNLSTKKR